MAPGAVGHPYSSRALLSWRPREDLLRAEVADPGSSAMPAIPRCTASSLWVGMPTAPLKTPKKEAQMPPPNGSTAYGFAADPKNERYLGIPAELMATNLNQNGYGYEYINIFMY